MTLTDATISALFADLRDLAVPALSTSFTSATLDRLVPLAAENRAKLGPEPRWEDLFRTRVGDWDCEMRICPVLRRELISFFTSRAVPSAHVEDLAQIVLVCLFDPRKTWVPSRPLGALIARLANYTLMTYRRSHEARQVSGYDIRVEDRPEYPLLNEAGPALQVIACASPEKAHRYLQIGEMRYVGMTWDEIGDALGEEGDAVRVSFGRLRTKVEAVMRMERGEG